MTKPSEVFYAFSGEDSMQETLNYLATVAVGGEVFASSVEEINADWDEGKVSRDNRPVRITVEYLGEPGDRMPDNDGTLSVG